MFFALFFQCKTSSFRPDIDTCYHRISISRLLRDTVLPAFLRRVREVSHWESQS